MKEVLCLDASQKHIFRFINLVKILKSKPFTEAWIFHHSWRYVLACKLAGIEKIYGYGNNWTQPYLTYAEFNTHPIQKHKLCLPSHSSFKTDNLSIEHIENSFRTNNKPWIVLGIGGTEIFLKWPMESFALLARYLSNLGTVFILGGSAEEEEAKRILPCHYFFGICQRIKK